jgi:SAM-dependent methyltransferase
VHPTNVTFRDHFSGQAAIYAEFRPRYPAALADLLRSLTAGDTAWDIGCGNGQLTIALAERFARVIATDPSESQLALAEPHPHAEYRKASAEDSGLPDVSIDLAVAAQAAHWFDWPRFVVEVGRVTKPGGAIALFGYGKLFVDGAAGDEILRYHDDIVGPYWPAGREHIENSYRDLRLPYQALPAPAPGIDMTVAWTRDELVGYLASWSATVRMTAAEGPAAFEALQARLASTWPDGERRAIRWPLFLQLYRR